MMIRRLADSTIPIRLLLRFRLAASVRAGWLPWIAPLLVILLWASFFPFLYNLYASFHEFNPLRKEFDPVGADNWMRALGDPRVHNALRVTFLYSLIGIIIEMVLGAVFAVLLSEAPFGRGILQTVYLLPLVVPPSIVGLMFQLMEHSEFGIISYVLYANRLLTPAEPLLGGQGKYALLGILLPEIWQWTPFVTAVLLAGIQSQPPELAEAASVDGATFLQRTRFITLPLLAPVLSIVILFRLIDLFRIFDYVYVMTSGGPGTRTEVLSFYVWQQTFGYVKWGYGATLALVMMVVILGASHLFIRVARVRW
jgi:multiple sugar transport system permease protein